jgi:hypothetical protein
MNLPAASDRVIYKIINGIRRRNKKWPSNDSLQPDVELVQKRQSYGYEPMLVFGTSLARKEK